MLMHQDGRRFRASRLAALLACLALAAVACDDGDDNSPGGGGAASCEVFEYTELAPLSQTELPLVFTFDRPAGWDEQVLHAQEESTTVTTGRNYTADSSTYRLSVGLTQSHTHHATADYAFLEILGFTEEVRTLTYAGEEIRWMRDTRASAANEYRHATFVPFELDSGAEGYVMVMAEVSSAIEDCRPQLRAALDDILGTLRPNPATTFE